MNRAHIHIIKETSLLASDMHNLVFCFTEHFACSYYCQCKIITFLTLNSDNIAKPRISLKGILLTMPANKIKDTSFNLGDLLFHIEVEGKCGWIIGGCMLPPPPPPARIIGGGFGPLHPAHEWCG